MDKFLCLFLTVFSVSTASSLYTEGPTRIVNGIPAVENEFPYMVSLQKLSQVHITANRGHTCGGALVTLQHAVTSVSCILETIEGLPGFHVINPAEYRVFGGSVLLTNDNSPARIRRIANFTIHPEYNINNWENRFINNIAVITLGTPFEGNSVARLLITDIGPGLMPSNFTGWGTAGTRLLYEQVLAADATTCRLYLVPRIVMSQVCGFGPFGISVSPPGATLGDEGGPLVYGGRLLGILISRENTGHYNPHLYTRVANYSTWIDYVIAQPIAELGPEPSTQPPPTPTTPSPGGASTIQPGMTVLAVVIAQIITLNVLNKSFIKTIAV